MGVHYFQTNPSDQIESKSNQYQYLYLNLYLSISLLIVYEPVNLLEGSTMFEFLTSGWWRCFHMKQPTGDSKVSGRWDVGKWTRRTSKIPSFMTHQVRRYPQKKTVHVGGLSGGSNTLFSCGRGPNSQRWLCLLVHVVTTTYLVLMVPSTSILSHPQAGGSISIFPQVSWWNLHWWCLHDPLWS